MGLEEMYLSTRDLSAPDDPNPSFAAISRGRAQGYQVAAAAHV